MGGRKTQYKDYYASTGTDQRDSFGTLWDSMVTSGQFKRLSLGARFFYALCRVQWKSAQGRAYLYQHAKEESKTYREPCFVFPAAHMEVYGIQRQNGARYIRELVQAGFIDVEEQNGHRRKPNVYAFSDKWKGL